MTPRTPYPRTFTGRVAFASAPYAPFPPSFKAANKPRVIGGRWEVRKIIRPNGEARWQARCKGTASRHSASFYSHATAVEWAQTVALTYAAFGTKPNLIDINRILDYARKGFRRRDTPDHTTQAREATK